MLDESNAGPSTSLRSGRDDNFVAKCELSREIIDLKINCHPDRSEPGFPATQHRTRQRVRLSFTERRMKFAEATKFHRKSGGAKWRACPERSRTGTCG